MTVYADNAATMKPSEIAIQTMLQQMEGGYGNPSALYTLGRDARRTLERARAKAARALGAFPDEIFFTSGGTESNNWAIQSTAELYCEKGRHIISTKIEHPAVLNCLKHLESHGFSITYLGADMLGQVSPKQVKDAIRADTILITIMVSNNEVGTILPIADIAGIAVARGVTFHTDAVQSVGHVPVDVKALNADMLSVSGHKFGAPRGIGALYVKRGLKLPPLLHGGGQERGMRSGTEDIPSACAFAAALEDSVSRLEVTVPQVSAMRDRLIDGLLTISGAHLTGDSRNRLPGIASFAFEGVESEALVLALSDCGIYASAGSACSSGVTDASHVLLAMGVSKELSRGSLRLSINENNTDEEIDYILQKMPEIITQLRK